MASRSLLRCAFSFSTVARVLAILGCCAGLDGRSATAAPVNPGLADYAWLFDGNDSALHGGIDGSRQGSGGANPTGPIFSSDTPFNTYTGNRSLSFDGSDDRFIVPDAPELRPGTGAWTAGFWFKAPNINQFGPLVNKRQEGGQFNQWSIIQGSIQPGGTATASKRISILLRDSVGGNWWFRSDEDIVDGSWHQVTFARSAAGVGTLYVDGLAKTMTQVSLSGTPPHNIDNTVPWTFGWNNGSTFYQGFIDEVGLWNSALTVNHAEWLAANSLYLPPVPEPSSLLSCCLGLLACSPWRRRVARRSTT